MPPPQAILNLGFENAEWNLTLQGKYLLIKDPRSLYQIYHPWDISKYGDFAVTSTQVTIPEDWQNSVFLNLYASDTYVSEGWEHTKPRWIHTYAVYHHFVDHRYKLARCGICAAVPKADVGGTEDLYKKRNK